MSIGLPTKLAQCLECKKICNTYDLSIMGLCLQCKHPNINMTPPLTLEHLKTSLEAVTALFEGRVKTIQFENSDGTWTDSNCKGESSRTRLGLEVRYRIKPELKKRLITVSELVMKGPIIVRVPSWKKQLYTVNMYDSINEELKFCMTKYSIKDLVDVAAEWSVHSMSNGVFWNSFEVPVA